MAAAIFGRNDRTVTERFAIVRDSSMRSSRSGYAAA